MVRRPQKIGLPYVALAALASALLITGSAWAADLRLPPNPAAQKEVPLKDARKAKFEEFLRSLQKHNNQ